MGWDGMVWDGMGWDGIGMRKDELTCEYCLLESFKKLKYSYRIMAWLRIRYRTSLRNASHQRTRTRTHNLRASYPVRARFKC